MDVGGRDDFRTIGDLYTIYLQEGDNIALVKAKGGCIIMKKGKILIRMAMVTLGLLCLSACSGGNEESGTQETGQKKESSADISQFSDIDGTTWQDSWVEKTASGVSVNIDVNAYTTIPDLGRMSVVEVERYEFSEKNKKEIIEGLFGGEVCYYEMGKRPEFIVNKLLQDARERQKDVEDVWKSDQEREMTQDEYEFEKDDYERELKDVKAEIKKYEKYLKKAPKDFVKIKEDDYKGNQYLGERDGIQYEFSYETGHDEYGESATINMEPYDANDVTPDSLQGNAYAYLGAETTGIEHQSENQCKISKEDAEEAAKDFVQKAGFPDLIKTEEGVLMWVGTKENGDSVEPTMDGWHFAYSPGVEGAAFTDSGFESSGVSVDGKDSTFGKYSMNCSVHVYVTDKGVIEAKWNNPIQIISSVPGVKLLPFAAIKDIVRNQMTEYAEYFIKNKDKKTIRFDRMELVYCRVSDPDDEKKFTYVPTWRLRNNSGVENTIFFVNAMDGSLIKEWDVVWGELKMW